MTRHRSADHIEETAIAGQAKNGEQPVDVARRFVRVIRRRADEYVEFQFSIHHEEIFVELVLPIQAFDEFCTRNNVVFLESP